MVNFKKSSIPYFTETVGLMALTIAAGLFLAGRILYFRNGGYMFLVWNIFLAWIPYGCTLLFLMVKNKPLQYILCFLWLIFYPNAPYMITDLIHIAKYTFYGDIVDGKRVFLADFAMWFDLLLICSFILIGLVLSYVSLSIFHQLIKEKYNRILGWIFVLGIALCSGFAMYLGRFIRLNSWEIITNPFSLLQTVFRSLGGQAIAFTVLFAVFHVLLYTAFNLINKRDSITE